MGTRTGIKSCAFVKLKWTNIVSQVSQAFLFTYEYRHSLCTPPPLAITIKSSQTVLKSSEYMWKNLWTVLSMKSLGGAVGFLHLLYCTGIVIIRADFHNSDKYKSAFL